MAIPVTCGQCGSKFNASDAMRGKRGKCPTCAAVITVGDPADSGDWPPPFTPVPATAARPPQPPAGPQTKACPYCGEQILLAAIKCKHCGEMLQPAVRTANAAAQHRAPTRAAADSSQPMSRQQARGANRLAISSILLALLAFLFCWVPVLGILSIVFALLGLLLGGLGLAIARFRSVAAVGFSIAGVLLSATSLVLAATGFIRGATTTTAAEPVATAAKPAIDEVAMLDAASQAVLRSDAAKLNAADSPKAAAEPAEPQWVDAHNPVQQGDVRVSVGSVRVGVAPNKPLLGNPKSKEKTLLVSLTIENLSDSRKLDFKSFSAGGLVNETRPDLEDNFGNHYRQMTSGIEGLLEGQSIGNILEGQNLEGLLGGQGKVESIYPGKSITDMLVFEAPIDKAAHLHLELPAAAFGGTGTLRFEIPRDMIAR